MKASDVRKGSVVEHNNTVYQVRDIERSSPQGRGGNVTFRFTLYSVPAGTKYDLSLRADDELKEIDLVRREAAMQKLPNILDSAVDIDDDIPKPLRLVARRHAPDPGRFRPETRPCAPVR